MGCRNFIQLVFTLPLLFNTLHVSKETEIMEKILTACVLRDQIVIYRERPALLVPSHFRVFEIRFRSRS